MSISNTIQNLPCKISLIGEPTEDKNSILLDKLVTIDTLKRMRTELPIKPTEIIFFNHDTCAPGLQIRFHQEILKHYICEGKTQHKEIIEEYLDKQMCKIIADFIGDEANTLYPHIKYMGSHISSNPRRLNAMFVLQDQEVLDSLQKLAS